MVEEKTNVNVNELPVPKGVSEELAQWVKEPVVDKNLYPYKELAERVRNMPVVPKIPLCYDELDDLLDGGMQGGELMIVSAPTKNGKSSLCQNISFKQGLKDIPTLWLTLEMSWQEITRKFGEMHKGYNTSKKKESLPIYYPVDTRGVGLEWVENHIRNAKEKYGVKMVFIDHLHFLVKLQGSTSNISFAIGEIVRGVKQLAVKYEIPIILIAHTKKLDVTEMPDINSIRDCLAGDQLIYSNGLQIPVSEIKPGDPVVSRGANFNLKNDEVKGAWPTGKKKIYRITTRTGKTIDCSDGHKFFACTYKSADKFGPNQKCGISGWVKLKDLRVGQKIATVNRYPENNNKSTITVGQAEILGWVVGDGHVTPKGSTEITVNTFEEVKYLESLFESEFGVKCSYLKYEDKKAFRFYLKGEKWLSFIRGIGYSAISDKKYIPEVIFKQPNDIVAGFIRGLFHADGSVSKSGVENKSLTLILNTISPRLAKQLQHLLLRFNIKSFVRKTNQKKSGFRSKNGHAYAVGVYGSFIKTFSNDIGFCLEKQKKLDRLLVGFKHKDKLRKSMIGFERIRSIKYIGDKETYDIEVVGSRRSVENNSFCVNDFLTHNSSFIAQESDFAVILWRERKKRKPGTDIMDNEEIYTDRTILSLETNRRTGKSKKIALGFLNNVFYSLSEYYGLIHKDEAEERISHMGDKKERLERAINTTKNMMFGERDDDIDVEEAFGNE